MKDVFSQRAQVSFWNLMEDFAESMVETFPDCEETKEWKLWLLVIGEDAVKRREGIEKWHAAMCTPLRKGSAKYAKAIVSLTGHQPTVYHAVSYRDVEAIHATDPKLERMDFPSKFRGSNMDASAKDVFWQYFSELNRHAFDALRETPPKVPTTEEITRDIAMRKAQGAAAKSVGSLMGEASQQGGGGNIEQGILELWKKLCTLRGKESSITDSEELSKKLQACDVPEDADLSQRSKSVLMAFEEDLGVSPPLDEAQWTTFMQARNLSTMHSAVPSNMMRNIESVASKLVQDVAEGRASLESMDVEAIGQQVLSSVSPEEISAFAGNLDKILPALQKGVNKL